LSRHAPEPFIESQLHFLILIKSSFNMHTVSSLRVHHPPDWKNDTKREVLNRLSLGTNAKRLASVVDGGRLINSIPSRSKSRSEKFGMVLTGVSATVQRFTSMVT
jgi:hypothetical protein